LTDICASNYLPIASASAREANTDKVIEKVSSKSADTGALGIEIADSGKAQLPPQYAYYSQI